MTKPPRKRFRIHLSTAIVLMFVAGGLLWANFHGDTHVAHYDGAAYTYPFSVTWRDFGFPVHTYNYAVDTDGAPSTFVSNEIGQANVLVFVAVGLNVVFAAILLSAVWLTCEWLIDRRAGRNSAK